MAKNGDTLEPPKAKIISIFDGGKKDEELELHPACLDAISALEDCIKIIRAGKISSLVVVSLSTEGDKARVLLTRNRFELLGLVKDIEAQTDLTFLYVDDDEG